jgi:hypothetical protein
VHDPEHALEDLAVIGGGASRGWTLGRQERRDARPALLGQRWEWGNEQGSGEGARRGHCDGGVVCLEGTAPDMCLLRAPLMPPTPLRPVQMKSRFAALAPEQLQQAPDLRNAVADQAPFFVVAAALRATTRSACASSASVIWRYHAGQRRTS